ncbi:hypothetical protein [Rickettsia sp.]|uniref:hypothetical protein n=1 Tax=Rickettsia sp. TaxID=789 RepID=UPI00397E5291
MYRKTHSVSYRGLTTVSKKQLKVPIILVFLTGSRGQAYSTGQFLLYVIPAKAGIQSNKALFAKNYLIKKSLKSRFF